MYQVPLVVYEQLREATPEEKRDIVLSLIEEHPRHRLELPERDGMRADLSRVDLSSETLQGLVERRAGVPAAWWDALYKGAKLSFANLQGANLSFANLQDADLAGANLQGANLFQAKLQRANLILANLQDASLRQAKLQEARLLGANLQGAYLFDANLQGAYLWVAKLQGARLYDAKLQGAHLRLAELQGVDLSRSKMRHCYLSEAWLDRTRLRRDQLGGAVGEERDGDYRGARVAYLGLKQNFDTLGDYAAASWAYRKERRMEKREALKEARYAKAVGDQIVELVCDYGEGFWRVLGCLAVLWFDFAVFYGIMGHVLADRGPVYSTTRNPFDLLSFSLATMVTLEAPGLRPFASLLMRILMPLQAALGIFFLGLLGFVAGNRIRRS